MNINSGLKESILESNSGNDGFLQGHAFLFQLSRYFDDIRLDNSRELNVLMGKIDGGLDEGVNVKRRAAVGTAIVVLDLLYFVLFGVDSAPNRLIRD